MPGARSARSRAGWGCPAASSRRSSWRAPNSAGAQTVRLASQANKIRVLEGHAELLREALAGAEAVGRQHARERDALREEVASLRAALGARRQRRRVGWMAVLAMLVVAGGLGGVGYSLPWLYGALHTAPSGGAPVYHTAQVRDRASVLRQQPDPAAPEVSTLPVGARLTVRRVLWHNLMQWVEVDFDGKSGFVLSTDVDLSQRETPLELGLALRVDARAHPERGRPWGARRAPRSHAPRSLGAKDQGSWRRRSSATSSCKFPPARQTPRRRSVPRSASAGSTSWPSSRNSTPSPPRWSRACRCPW